MFFVFCVKMQIHGACSFIACFAFDDPDDDQYKNIFLLLKSWPFTSYLTKLGGDGESM